MKAALLASIPAPFLLAASTAHSRPQQQQPPHLTLRTYNYAEIQSPILDSAKRETNRILGELSIETRWRDCPTSPDQLAANRACAGPSGPTHLILNLLPRSMSKKYGFNQGVFGFALPTPHDQPGTKISLFFDRVLDLAYRGGVGAGFENAQAIILGHMMAHEIGHLLLGPDSHNSRGVMRFPWNERTLTNMERGRLRFTERERVRIHKEMARRAGRPSP